MSPEAPSFSLERPPGHLSGCRVPPDWQCFSTFPVGEAPGDQCVCSGAQATHTHLTESYLVPMGLKTCFGKQGKGLPESCLRAVPGKLPGGAKGQGAQLPVGRSLRQQCTPAFPLQLLPLPQLRGLWKPGSCFSAIYFSRPYLTIFCSLPCIFFSKVL